MLSIQNISKTYYKSTPNEVKALQNLSLDIAKHTFLILVGANGSGKSTLLNAIAGSLQVDAGKIWMENTEVTRLKDFQRSPWIARIFQNPLSGTAPDLTILDNFRLAALRTQRKKLRLGITSSFRKDVQEKISLLDMGLENKLNQKMGTLSGGQRQALTLMMAIMDEAKILLMDEPSAALDPKSAKNLMEKAQMVIDEYQLTAILVTHDLKDAFQYGNRIIQMQEGRILRDYAHKEKKNLTQNDLFQWFV